MTSRGPTKIIFFVCNIFLINRLKPQAVSELVQSQSFVVVVFLHYFLLSCVATC